MFQIFLEPRYQQVDVNIGLLSLFGCILNIFLLSVYFWMNSENVHESSQKIMPLFGTCKKIHNNSSGITFSVFFKD